MDRKQKEEMIFQAGNKFYSSNHHSWLVKEVYSFKIPLYKVMCSEVMGAAQCVQGLAMTFKLPAFTNETPGEISYPSFWKKKCY